MSAVHAYNLRIDGITGWNPLNVPLQDPVTDWRLDFVQPLAGKVSTAEADISTNLITWEMLTDLSKGAFKKFFDPEALRYYLPSPSGTGDAWADDTVYPLAWTLRPTEPLMCGCGHLANNGDYALRDITEFEDALYAIDSKNHKVMKLVTGTWTDQTAGLNGTYPTWILSGGGIGTSTLYVGTNTGTARKYITASGWSDFTAIGGAAQAAQCFTLVGSQGVGYVLWYSNGNIVYERINNGRAMRVGDDHKRIRSLLWFDNYIIVGKRDGYYRAYPDSKIVRPLLVSANRTAGNGRILLLHRDRAYFNLDGELWSWDGKNRFRETPAEFESAGGTDPFYKGLCVGAHSDGAHLYVWYRVKSGTSYHYYLLSKLGDTPGQGWHPILLVTTSIAPGTGLPSGADEPGAAFLDSDKLYYSVANSVANNGRGITGNLHTTGDTPLRTANERFTRNVAVHVGWYDGKRRALDKFIKEVRYTLRCQGSTGQVKFYYRKWADTVWTAIGESTAGTQDNSTMAIPTESGAQLGATVDNYFALKVELTNTDSTPDDAWWLSDLYLVGLPSYPATGQGSFAAWLRDGLDHPVPYDRHDIYQGLKAGINQAAPVKLTAPDGSVYYVKLRGGAQQRMEKVETSEQGSSRFITHSKFVVQFVEMA